MADYQRLASANVHINVSVRLLHVLLLLLVFIQRLYGLGRIRRPRRQRSPFILLLVTVHFIKRRSLFDKQTHRKKEKLRCIISCSQCRRTTLEMQFNFTDIVYRQKPQANKTKFSVTM